MEPTVKSMQKKHSILILLKILFISIVSFQTINAETVLTLNTFSGPPLSTEDQKGLYDLIIIEGFKRVGRTVRISHLPAERSIFNANMGIDDGDFVRISGLDRLYSNLIQVPEKIIDYEFSAFTRNIDIRPEGWSSLTSYNLAIVRGWKILEKNLKDAKTLFRVKNQRLLFNMLDKGRVDLVVYSKYEGNWIIKKNRYDSIKVLEPPLAIREMFLYLNKRHKRLVPLLDQAFKNMKSDGTYGQIMAEFLEK
ncbi:MAG: transporter substrate-binding domain-containing protein [Deltaproteobacteria bacterium]|jgi:polar amino acid transport system substrate-binding protein|nr:transporter substrate-binding domain-containing protein [Deltaproteobacteria bacterium]MBT4644674.1 transporter substrate-binding domain-containing protein [Deltaproteobacteria bacterium]MBT6500631.1 transporter substrate-binding domain-containing protein [Deltaproteobacteria bacterium]MBT6614459.1 transporter substrate-binding domain-containing protein [Deltaproteobacteria bacterium]MBT7152573.1 transporter substrate-binding domain-containing protein [Deltaproteobacteria bacterium]